MSAVPVLLPTEFKRLLKKETKLLHSLFKIRKRQDVKGRRTRTKIIDGASEDQINFLIQLLHFIFNGHIKPFDRHIKKQFKTRKNKFCVDNFKSAESFQRTQQKSLADKRKLLIGVGTWRYILHRVFRD